jgi:hypothetical protein
LKNTVTQAQVEEIIKNSEIHVITSFGKTTTVTAKLPNGFVIVESSSCVDPANYDENLGKHLCMERIENKIWELEGYVLQKELYCNGPNYKVTQIAKLCHEVNRAYCKSIGDTSQPSWEDAPDWQKDSAKNGVEFHLNNETTPEQSHENWMKDKVADGWVYGDVKCPEKKTHPCMVSYDQLPIEQRTKDYLFKAIVDTNK